MALSIKKLEKPDNNKQKNILKAAYAYSVQVSEEKIKQHQQSTDRFKWDRGLNNTAKCNNCTQTY